MTFEQELRTLRSLEMLPRTQLMRPVADPDSALLGPARPDLRTREDGLAGISRLDDQRCICIRSRLHTIHAGLVAANRFPVDAVMQHDLDAGPLGLVLQGSAHRLGERAKRRICAAEIPIIALRRDVQHDLHLRFVNRCASGGFYGGCPRTKRADQHQGNRDRHPFEVDRAPEGHGGGRM